MKTDRKALVYCPDWSRDNPYQKLLYTRLTNLGVPCTGISGLEFSIAWLRKNKSTVKYLHFHWLFGIYDPKNSGLDVAKAKDFILKVILAKLLGYRIIWTVHNFISHEPSHRGLEVLIRKTMSHLADRIIVHCNYARELLRREWQTCNEKVAVVPHGSYVEYYSNHMTGPEARRKLGLKDSEFVFLFFGMIRNYKGLKQLFHSYAEVKKINPNVQLVVAGKPFDDEIKTDIEHHCKEQGALPFLRFIPDEEVQLFFNASDVVVLPYQNILTSGAALLSLSFGKPLIVPSRGCIPELIDEQNGFPYFHDRELTETMLRALRQPALPELGRQALRVAKELSWEHLTKNIYLSLLNSM